MAGFRMAAFAAAATMCAGSASAAVTFGQAFGESGALLDARSSIANGEFSASDQQSPHDETVVIRTTEASGAASIELRNDSDVLLAEGDADVFGSLTFASVAEGQFHISNSYTLTNYAADVAHFADIYHLWQYSFSVDTASDIAISWAGGFGDLELFGNVLLSSQSLTGASSDSFRVGPGNYTIRVTDPFANTQHSLMGVGSISGSEDMTVDFQISDAVPEPSTWAMMILGFGAAGAVLRRRQLVTH